MSSRTPDLLSNIFASGLQPRAATFPRGMIPMKSRGSGEASGDAFVPPASRRRTAIWDMHHSMHCSIIGTCLSTTEIRRLLIKLGVHGAESASDHDLHKQGVTLAGQAQGGGKFIQKALDRRHEAAIKQFAKAQDEGALCLLWDDAVRRGDIPGAYWAVLSHPAATDAVMRRVFGDVHMLSHLVGAANRADIRRLRQLEGDNATLEAKVGRQQQQLRDAVVSRETTIQQLRHSLEERIEQDRNSTAKRSVEADPRVLLDLIGDLRRRQATAESRCQSLGRQLEICRSALMTERSTRADIEKQ